MHKNHSTTFIVTSQGVIDILLAIGLSLDRKHCFTNSLVYGKPTLPKALHVMFY